MTQKTANQSSIFEIFSSAVPDSMKVTAPVPVKSTKGVTKSSAKSVAPYKPKEPEIVLVPLPVTVYYAREHRVLDIIDFPEDEITYKKVKKADEKPNITVKKEADTGDTVDAASAAIEKACMEAEGCCADSTSETERIEDDSIKKVFRTGTAAVVTGTIDGEEESLDIDIIDCEEDTVSGNDEECNENQVGQKESTDNANSDPEASETKEEEDGIPKVTLESIRQKLVWDWPELTKERTKMDYDKEKNVVVPVVYSGAKGFVI